uniref:FATC domain-containing protein n=1 Tax=Meloidogyne enterolobii TaxID=390850 RepID=A0A6V7U920_MELEN|nr:unnamed protein product [Meloidogyne enterolobii]
MFVLGRENIYVYPRSLNLDLLGILCTLWVQQKLKLGIFRLSCERVLEMLREDKQVLLLLLETFKFDSMLDLSSLQSASTTRKTHEEMASEVINRIEQKLLGCELIYNRSNVHSKDMEGINNNIIMASGMLRLPKVNTGEENTNDEGEELNEEDLSKAKDLKKEPTPSSEWKESEQLSVSEQVDLLINESTDLSNLALMYEGWTSWV